MEYILISLKKMHAQPDVIGTLFNVRITIVLNEIIIIIIIITIILCKN